MQERLLADIYFYQEGPGVRKWQFKDKGVKLLNGGNINKGIINLDTTNIYIDEDEAYGKYEHFLIDEGDLVIACSGVLVENFHNKIAFIKKEHLPLCLNTSTMRFKQLPSKEGTLDYLKYFLKSNYFKKQIGRLITGSAQLNFGPSHIKQIKIPLPPLEEQKAIAARLDKADEIRQLNQQIINHYDELIQALFIDMFGDPVKNEKGWDLLNLKNITLKLGSGSTPKGGKQNYKTSGISLIRSMNVYDAYFSFNDLAFIDEEQAEKLKNVALESGDILFNITGASVCRCTIVPDYILPARVNQHVSIIRVNSDAISNIYLNRLLISKSVKQQLLKIGSGGGAVMEAITKEKLENFDVIVPPIKLQNQFAECVQKIEAQKELAVQALKQSEDLFNSLLQQAFKK